MQRRFQAPVSGGALAPITAWVRHVGKVVFVPVAFCALVERRET
jgi:hypothetical protein